MLLCIDLIFKDLLIDTSNILDYTDYYITDTHINNKGSLKVYEEIINYLNNKFNVLISANNYKITEQCVLSLSSLDKGIGDLTWDINKEGIILNDISDIYYKFENVDDFYLDTYNIEDNYLILNYNFENISNSYIGKRIDWLCISNNILYKKNINYFIKQRVVIFYDSFLAHVLNLYKNIFEEVYLIKTIFTEEILNKINPDFIIETRVERFLF